MANVYSHSFFIGSIPGGGLQTIATIDSTHVGVIRAVTAFGSAPSLQPLNGITLYVDGTIFIALQSPHVRAGFPYLWDTHVVVPAGGVIQSSSSDTAIAPWSLTVSGYLLTLP